MGKNSKWNHNICWDCWRTIEKLPDGRIKPPPRIPGSDDAAELSEKTCCWCGRFTIEGLWRRMAPASVPCRGEHQD